MQLTRYWAGLIIWGVTTTVHAGQWQLDEALSGSVIYTDNVDLTARDQEGEWIATLTPRASLRGEGARARLSLDAAVQLNTLSDERHIRPRLGAKGELDLVDQWLYLDGSATITQSVVDAFQPGDADLLNRTDNTVNTYNLQLSPYLTHRFGAAAELTGRYRANAQRHSGHRLGDSLSHETTWVLQQGADFTRLLWAGQFSYRKTEHDRERSDSELRQAALSLGYRFTPQWQVVVSAGREWNDYQTLRADTDGDVWMIQSTWQPSQRTLVRLGYVDRYFAKAPSLFISHRRRHSLFILTYAKELTDAAARLSRQTAFVPPSELDDAIAPGLPAINNDDPLINPQEGVFVNERLDLGYTLTGQRTRLKLLAGLSRQSYEDGRQDETLQRYAVEFDRRLSAQLSLYAGVGVSRQRRDQGEQARLEDIHLGLIRSLGEDGQIELNYRVRDRDADDDSNDYQEHRVQLGFTQRF